jgi:TonB family protein
VQGSVVLEAEIWPDGRAHNIVVVKSIGYSDLDRSALKALELWEFTPARKNGVAVKVRGVRVDLAFNPPADRTRPSLSKEKR